MSAVVSFVSDVVETVVDTVGDVVETVVDVVQEVAKPIISTVEKIIEDPLPTIVALAGQAVGIPAPLTMAAITAAKGGDLEDIILSAGMAAIAPTVTNSISTTLSSVIGDSIINEAVSNTVIDGVSRGLVNGAVAEVRGGDFTDAFAGSFTGTIVNSSVGEFTNEFIKPEVQDMLADSGLNVETVNTIVNEGSRALSAGLTAEITGRGDFDSAFINSVQNSTINIGTNYASNTIAQEFKTIETGLNDVEQKTGSDEEKMPWDDYFSLETTRDQDISGAGIGDSLVEEVQVADTGLDTGNATQAVNDMWQNNNYEDLIGSSQDVIDEFAKQPVSDEEVVSAEPILKAATTPEEQLPVDEEVQYDIGAADTQNLFDYVQALDEQAPVGGLASAIPEYSVEQPKEKAEDVYDPYAGVAEENFGLVDSGTVDVAPVIEGGLNKSTQGLVDTGEANIGDSALNMVMKNIVTPAIRQGLTKAVRGTPTRRVAQPPARQAKPRPQLTPDQLAKIRGGLQQQPAQKLDMSNILSQAQRPVAPPKKMDVSKLTPVTSVASLTELLAKKG